MIYFKNICNFFLNGSLIVVIAVFLFKKNLWLITPRVRSDKDRTGTITIVPVRTGTVN